MKHYYIDGAMVTKEEAERQAAINDEAMKTDDLTEWAKCKFILVFENGILCGIGGKK